MERIKQASMASGYRFKIVSLKTASDTSVFEILNFGVAPFYYDAYIAVDGIRSPKSLKLLAPGETQTFGVSAGAENAAITIECDRLVEGQKIQFHGTQELPVGTIPALNTAGSGLLYPNPVRKGESVFMTGSGNGEKIRYALYNGQGKLERSGFSDGETVAIETGNLIRGIYILKVEGISGVGSNRFLIL
jgi:hypothetical protein